MRRHALLFALLALLVVLAGCSPKAEEPRKVTIAMGYIPNVQFTPIYVAIERGYFADEGLEVTLDYGAETDLLQEVGANRLQFAAASGDQVVTARANGLPVRYVANWYRRFPVCVVTLAESGISTPEQLVGKTVGTTQMQGASYIGWLAFLEQAGIPSDQVNLQVIGYTQVASLVEKRVDAVICYAMNEPIQMINSGYEINVMGLDHYTNLVSNGIITNDETIEKDPELVHGVVRAFLRGLQDTLDDPDAAFAITRGVITDMNDETAVLQRAVLDACLDYWQNDVLGQSDAEAWAESVTLLRGLGLITVDVDPEALYANEFIE